MTLRRSLINYLCKTFDYIRTVIVVVVVVARFLIFAFAIDRRFAIFPFHRMTFPPA